MLQSSWNILANIVDLLIQQIINIGTYILSNLANIKEIISWYSEIIGITFLKKGSL